MDEIISLKWVRAKGVDISNFENEWSVENLKQRELHTSNVP